MQERLVCVNSLHYFIHELHQWDTSCLDLSRGTITSMLKLGLECRKCGDSLRPYSHWLAIYIYIYIYIYLHNWLHTTQERAIWTQAENIYHRPNHSMFIIQRTLQSLQCSCCCGQAPGAVPMKANWFSIKPGNVISQSCCCFCCWHHCLQNLET